MDTIPTAVLIRSLDDDYGVSENTYRSIYHQVASRHGQAAGEKLLNAVDATDGRFYIAEGSADALIQEITEGE